MRSSGLRTRRKRRGAIAAGARGRRRERPAKLASFAAILLGAVILMLSVPRGWHAWSVLAACVVLGGHARLCALRGCASKRHRPALRLPAPGSRSWIDGSPRPRPSWMRPSGSRDAVDRRIEDLTRAPGDAGAADGRGARPPGSRGR